MTWVFGYGSIIWRPSFSYREARPALLRGWRRRFWQGSPDHRGTPVQPGRVVTLVEDAAARCRGIAFDVGGPGAERIFAALDARESGGYVRMAIDIEFTGRAAAPATTYFAPPDNDNFLGPASIHRIAAQVRASEGSSGHNVEYVLRLAGALRDLGIFDDEVHELEACLRERVTV
jgi:glutathione-specific gamma-glutamylcyclotransferase